MICFIRINLNISKRETSQCTTKTKANTGTVHDTEEILDEEAVDTLYEEEIDEDLEKHSPKAAVSKDLNLNTGGNPGSEETTTKSVSSNVEDADSFRKAKGKSFMRDESDCADVFTCNICGKKFQNDSNLKMHIEGAHSLKRALKRKSEQKQMVSGTSRLPCDICGKTFKGKHKDRHMKTHLSTEKQFKCSECDKVFTKELERMKHKREVHGKCPTCTLCGKAFQYQNTLNLHMIRQHGHKTEFSCDICGVGFPIKSKLLRHKNVHEGLKSHQCATCGKVFKSIESVCGHRAVHSDEPKMECTQCGAKFRSKYNLARHELEVHITGNTKSFCCDQCGKGFKRAENLKVHKELHLEERKYKCELCDKSYNIK